MLKTILPFAKNVAALYTSDQIIFSAFMNLQSLSLEQLEQLMILLPEEIRRREMADDEVTEAERRKRSVFASFQELAKKQGVSLADL